MATVFPGENAAPPLNASPSPRPPAPKPRPRSHRAPPKLTVGDVAAPAAIASALSIGRHFGSRGVPKPGREGAALAALLARMRDWAATVAPHHDVAEFVVAAQALGGNRELRGVLADVRLAELRQVGGGWEEVRRERASGGLAAAEGREADAELIGGAQGEVGALDAETRARIERSRLLAVERKRAAMAKRARAGVVKGTDVSAGAVRGGVGAEVVDLQDVVERGEDEMVDADMDLLDELEDANAAEACTSEAKGTAQDKEARTAEFVKCLDTEGANGSVTKEALSKGGVETAEDAERDPSEGSGEGHGLTIEAEEGGFPVVPASTPILPSAVTVDPAGSGSAKPGDCRHEHGQGAGEASSRKDSETERIREASAGEEHQSSTPGRNAGDKGMDSVIGAVACGETQEEMDTDILAEFEAVGDY